MSWFDKLFGEDNDSTEDYLNKRSQRRQKATQQEEQDSLLPQNNDVYERPKGKFRFPMRVLEEASQSEEQSTSNNQSSHENRKHYEPSSEAPHTHHKPRRRRHAYDTTKSNDVKKQDRSEHPTQHQSAPTDAVSEHKPHRGTRMRIQTDVLRANAETKSSHKTPSYQHSDFKASEVPSAIFGTQKPRPLDNGVIRTSDQSEEDKQPTSKPDDSNIQTQSNATEKVHDNDAYINTPEAHQSTQVDEEQPITSQSSPNTVESTWDNDSSQTSTEDESKESTKQTSSIARDNKISIENIYASQIVEEIRRERERKVLQKRQFKKALQQKRNAQQENNENDIQKAIDEMYAKQAQNHIGESSLDEEGNMIADAYDSIDTIESEHTQTNTQDFNNDNNEDAQVGATSPFNYEEIDLDQVSDVHTINDEYVDVSTEQINNKDDDEIAEYDSPNDDVDKSINKQANTIFEENNVPQQSLSEDELNSEQASDFNHYQASETPFTDAQYRELTQSHSELTNQEEDNHSETEDDLETSVHTSEGVNNSSSEDDLTSDSEDKDSNNIHESLEETVTTQLNDVSSEQHSSEMSENPENEASAVQDTQDLNSKQSDESRTNQTNRIQQPTRKGSKPFNVVMTPSDKKRMMDAKKQSKLDHIHASKAHDVSQNERHTTKQQDMHKTSEQQPQKSNIENDQHVSSYVENHTEPITETNNKALVSDSDMNEAEVIESDYKAPEMNETQQAPDEADVLAASHNDKENESQTDARISDSSHIHAETTIQVENINQPQDTGGLQSQSEVAKKEVTHQQDAKQNPDQQNLETSPSDIDTKQVGEGVTNNDSDKPTIRRGPNIKLPSASLLDEPEEHEIDNSWIEEKKQELNEAFYYFNVPAEVQNVTEGPSVTRFELSVEKGVKVSRITALQDDIKMALAAKDIRIEAPIPGTSLVGIEVPNVTSTKVNLRSIIEAPSFKNSESKLNVAMGFGINNEPLLMDIAKTPHALIAGATGSGKSVCINSILMSLLYKNHPEELRLLLIDPKMVELAPYNDLPHLVAPVITDVKAATQSLKWAVEEMERRYKVFAKYHVRNITAYNKKATYDDRMPKIVIVIDELADLMMMAPQEVEQSIARIAQKARACGIHMLVATQRPSVNVITGLIKANIPTRIAFMVSSSVDSRTILDSGGAERLLGYGDMLYLGSGMNKPIRVQGTFVSDDEIDDVVDFIKQQRDPDYLFEEKELLKKTETQSQDDLFDDVCRFMLQEGHISTSLVQRHFQIGYNRAARIVDQLEQLGYVSGANGSKPRDVYITESDLDGN
ncbi:DNA translocase FtsK [Staphylococcus casei]|uniref:DNA translocase FtsK n=1 Tax=Staphylococcus casei TaxID=201828 RepID=UPI000CD03D9E|nr:DNA translocase FtsK [Staphylococcus casei]PNZ58040.1 DNA translocase FtsK [Staphylococcus casei]WJE87461.1 DNA translocase FtsK [Staphylococcus casei]